MSWTVGAVSRKALIRKWVAGPDSAAIAPLVTAVLLGCTVRRFFQKAPSHQF
jgi:hypothetical protein